MSQHEEDGDLICPACRVTFDCHEFVSPGCSGDLLPLLCDHCGLALEGFVLMVVDNGKRFCSVKCRDNEAESEGMARAAANLR